MEIRLDKYALLSARVLFCLSLKMLTCKPRVTMFINYSSLQDQYYDRVLDLYFLCKQSGIAKWIRHISVFCKHNKTEINIQIGLSDLDNHSGERRLGVGVSSVKE